MRTTTYKLKLRKLWKLAQHSNLLRRKLGPHIEKAWIQTTVRKLLKHGCRNLYEERGKKSNRTTKWFMNRNTSKSKLL